MIPLDPPAKLTFTKPIDIGAGRTVSYAFDGTRGFCFHEGRSLGELFYEVATEERPESHADAFCLHGWKLVATGEDAKARWAEVLSRAGRS